MLSRYLLLTVVLHLCSETAAFLFWGNRRRSCSTTRCSWKWGPCSRSCGGGLREATLTVAKGQCGTCDMPATKDSCNVQCCPKNCYWWSWSSWGACSKTCGTGNQIRSRSKRSASCGGNPCSGLSSQTRSCNPGCCPVHCSWAAWGGWSSCSKSCGGGRQTRSRGYSTSPSCGGNACIGVSSQNRQCNGQCCPRHCSWASWSNWSGCSASCGGGHQNRIRIQAVKAACGGQKCLGINEDTRKCNTHCCPVNCVWDNWTSWGTCSATCGTGKQIRSREIKLLQSCGGLGCAATNLESQDCNSHCCPVDCSWGPWSDWGLCSVSCGGGRQNRVRGEDVPSFCGGSTCQGNATQSRRCNHHCCPVPCKWSAWSDWNSCSATCGGGRQHRIRSISIPSLCSGKRCVGPSTDHRVCNKKCCPVNCLWNDWSHWEDCSKSCERGLQRRTRTIAVHSQCNGTKCLGGQFHDRFCNEICCPVHCKWSDWGAWTQCTKSCGNGTQMRRRDIQLPRSCGGEECTGDRVEYKGCNEHCCPVDCSMSPWSDWSDCSQSCGPHGMKMRYRSISQPSSCGGKPCSKRFSAEESCNRICFNGGNVSSENCRCDKGWQGDCCEEDVNECVMSIGESGVEASAEESSGNTVCSNQATCINTDGSFICTCNTGFVGDGFDCSDLNECQWMEEGSGYSGDNLGLETSSCHINATCVNLVGSYICVCNHGYEGSGFYCRDVNECDEGVHDCDSATSDCVNLKGSHVCMCKEGFAGDGRSCTDVDECDTGKHDCSDRYQKCTNMQGGYKCDCRESIIMRNGKCEEKVSRTFQPGNNNSSTWITTLKKPELIAAIVAVGILIVLVLILITKVISRHSKGIGRIANERDDSHPFSGASADMNEDEL